MSELSGGINKMYGERQEKRAPMAEPVSFARADFVFAITMLVCGFLYWNLIRFESLGAGVSIFAAILCILAGIYLHLNGIGQTKESLLYLAIVALSAGSFFLFDNVDIKALNFLFLSLAFIYWIAVSTGRRLEGRLSAAIMGDGINQLLLVPFYNFNCGYLGMRSRSGKSKRSRGFLHALLGILIFLPILMIVVSLLMNADAAFERLVSNIRISISADILDYILQMILGIPVACYLFGLIYGNIHKRHAEHITLASIEKVWATLRFLPGITVYSALTVLNGVYLLFFLSQTSYLFSAFGDRLPEAMTYAEYARRGFFELCTVAAINLCVIGAAHLLAGRGEGAQEPTKALKAETVVLCIFTILLMATALRKMALYINYYGLTQLRVYTTWFMLVLFIVFVIVILRQFKRFNGTKVAAISFIICFLFLCYANVDSFIAKYNIDRYLEGSLENVDVAALGQLSDAAIPPMFDLYEKTHDEALKMELGRTILGTPWYETFRDFNVQSYKANQIREMFPLEP
ncbi:hypothetical protein MASR2M70_12540 [Bacillota bacterium]